MILFRLLGLVLLLNLIRYLVGGPIESITIAEPMHSVMPRHPDVFDTDFTTTDFMVSLGYNFMLWFVATVQFHLMREGLSGSMVVRSLKSFSLTGLFFISLAAVYMNHFTDSVKSFFAWSMVDALILFPLIGLANGFLYPLFFRDSTNRTG